MLQQRHRSDSQVNNRKSWVLRDGNMIEEKWQQVVVGDIIKMENDQFVAVRNLFCAIFFSYFPRECNLEICNALDADSPSKRHFVRKQ